jgi:hypothetical protein
MAKPGHSILTLMIIGYSTAMHIQILFYANIPHSITKKNDNESIESTITESMNANVSIESTITESMNANVSI